MQQALKLKAIKEWEHTHRYFLPLRVDPPVSACFWIMLQWHEEVCKILSSIYSCLWRVGSIESTWLLQEAGSCFTKFFNPFFKKNNFPFWIQRTRKSNKQKSKSQSVISNEGTDLNYYSESHNLIIYKLDVYLLHSVWMKTVLEPEPLYACHAPILCPPRRHQYKKTHPTSCIHNHVPPTPNIQECNTTIVKIP